MRNILIVLAVLGMLLLAGTAYTQTLPQYLVCDPQVGVTQYRLEIIKGGVVQPPLTVVAEADGSLKLDLTPYGQGVYSFKVYAAGPEGWWSEPSDPFDATKRAKAGGVRIQ